MLVWVGEREVGGVAEGPPSLLSCLMGRGRRSPSFGVPGVRSSLNFCLSQALVQSSLPSNGMCNLVTYPYTTPLL